MVKIVKYGQTSEKMVKILKIHGLVWFVWFDLGLKALNFRTVSVHYSLQGGHRAARAAKNLAFLICPESGLQIEPFLLPIYPHGLKLLQSTNSRILVTPVILLILHPQIHNKHPHSRQLELSGW